MTKAAVVFLSAVMIANLAACRSVDPEEGRPGSNTDAIAAAATTCRCPPPGGLPDAHNHAVPDGLLSDELDARSGG
jgi:hypothetical protein